MGQLMRDHADVYLHCPQQLIIHPEWELCHHDLPWFICIYWQLNITIGWFRHLQMKKLHFIPFNTIYTIWKVPSFITFELQYLTLGWNDFWIGMWGTSGLDQWLLVLWPEDFNKRVKTMFLGKSYTHMAGLCSELALPTT